MNFFPRGKQDGYSGGAVLPGFESTPILMDEAGTVTLAKPRRARIIAIHQKA